MIFLPTSNPQGLLDLIKGAIDHGRIKTWSYDDDGDFTLTNEIWNQKAWVTPQIGAGTLNFYIFRPKDAEISKAVYAVYHARLIESVLRFFDNELTDNASASALPIGPDDVG